MDQNKRLQELVNNFQSLLSRYEMTQKDMDPLDKLEYLVTKLEGGDVSSAPVAQAQVQAQAQAQAPAKQAEPTAKGSLVDQFAASFDPKIEAFKQATVDLGLDSIVKAGDLYIQCLKQQKAILATMAECKKPSNLMFMKDAVVRNAGELDQLAKTSFKDATFIKTLMDGLDMLIWYNASSSEELDDYLKAQYENIFFHGNKILKADKAKEVAWFNSYKAIAEAFIEFMRPKKDTILNWNGQATNAVAFFKSSVNKETVAVSKSAPEETKQQAAAQKPAPAQKAAPKKKAPIKELQGRTWVIENQENATILLKEDEVQRSQQFDISNCVNTTIEIQGKGNSVSLRNCKKCNIKVHEMIAACSMLKCEGMEVTAVKNLRTIALETCNQVKVNLTNATKNCEIQTVCTTGIMIKFPKEGKDDNSEDQDDFALVGIAETYITKIKSDALDTQGLEGLD